MSSIKERLLGAITVMDDDDALRLWNYILELTGSGWDTIEEEDPDEVDLQMIQEAAADPDCHVF